LPKRFYSSKAVPIRLDVLLVLLSYVTPSKPLRIQPSASDKTWIVILDDNANDINTQRVIYDLAKQRIEHSSGLWAEIIELAQSDSVFSDLFCKRNEAFVTMVPKSEWFPVKKTAKVRVLPPEHNIVHPLDFLDKIDGAGQVEEGTELDNGREHFVNEWSSKFRT